MEVEKAPDIQKMVGRILSVLNYEYINENRIICMRSHKSKANAYARIWSMPKMWQVALDIKTFYVIEVLHHHFDNQSFEEKEKILIHELLHIPKTFSGALLPHKHRGGNVDDKTVNKIYKVYLERIKKYDIN